MSSFNSLCPKSENLELSLIRPSCSYSNSLTDSKEYLSRRKAVDMQLSRSSVSQGPCNSRVWWWTSQHPCWMIEIVHKSFHCRPEHDYIEHSTKLHFSCSIWYVHIQLFSLFFKKLYLRYYVKILKEKHLICFLFFLSYMFCYIN